LQGTPWQTALAGAFTHPQALFEFLQLDPALLPAALQAATTFPLRVPLGYAALMRKGDPADPLLRQVLPLAQELQDQAGFDTNPVGDLQAEALPGLLQKYRGRALLIATGACAINCRYCFRRHYPYQQGSATPRQQRQILEHLRRDESLSEVILSGGDPLLLDDRRLAGWLDDLAAIPHLRRLRLHSRLPVVLPERISESLARLLAASRLQTVMVIHANHPREISAAVADGLQQLSEQGIRLLNQSVLLRGVNDSAETLAELSEQLFGASVMPYYLHLLDRVDGAAHFELPAAESQQIYQALLAALPGYLVPRLVREEVGAPSKTPVI
jgi:EF-P beta-lysylation protein EpmB